LSPDALPSLLRDAATRIGEGAQSPMDRVTESHLVLLDAWQVLSHANPAFESRRGGLIDVAWNGFPSPFFNLAVTARPPASLGEFEAALTETSAWAAERRAPWMLAVCHETLGALLPEATRVLERHGFAPMMPLTGMAADSLTPPRREKPAGMWLTEAEPAIGDHAIRLNEAAYQMPIAEPGSLPLHQPDWWNAPDRMVTALAVDGQPVSCAAVLGIAGVRYVALVATLPDARQKGYAEAAMRDVLERGLAAGLLPRTYLHATAAGRPVYERMGYRVTAEYTVYAQGH
jgi:GNAT superfamily N-acetyltransferase